MSDYDTNSLKNFLDCILEWGNKDKFLKILQVKRDNEFCVELNVLQINNYHIFCENNIIWLEFFYNNYNYKFRVDDELTLTYYNRSDVRFKVDMREKRRLELLKKRLGE